MDMKALFVTALVYLAMSTLVRSLMAEHRGPYFVMEPPEQVDFSNSTGVKVSCSAQGEPSPSMKWVRSDGWPVVEVSEILKTWSNGTLDFSPFRADDYRQHIHASTYRCVASNLVGAIISRDVHVRAVVMQVYEVQVYNEFVIQGNTAVFKCHIPSFVTDYVKVIEWIGEEYNQNVPLKRDGNFLMMPTGELHIHGAGPAEAQQSYRCRTLHRLTGETRLSSTAGKLILSNPQGSVSPRITDSKASLSVRAGDTAILPCASQGQPAPNYSWLMRTNSSQVIAVTLDERIQQIGGTLLISNVRASDKSTYVCYVSNTVGNQTAETSLTVIVGLSVYIQPHEQAVDMGKAATMTCIASGHPAASITWYKDAEMLLDDNGRSLSNQVLHLKAVQKPHKGMWQCFAQNDWESVHGTAELTLGDAAPELVDTFGPLVAREGTSLSVRCSASGNPSPRTTWYFNDQQLLPAIGIYMSNSVAAGGDVVMFLNMTKMSVENGGDYSCVFTNRIGKAMHTERIDVYGEPGILPMSTISVVTGENLVVKCRYFGYPISSITWEKDGMILPVNLRQRVYQNGTLIIYDIRKESDQGKYTCTIHSATGPGVSKTVEVKVLVPPKIIPFSFQDEDLYEGMRAQITCTIRMGDFPITITWLKNNNPIDESQQITTRLFDGFTSLLSISRVTYLHNGNYTCIAGNTAGAVNFTAQLNVNVPPKWTFEPSDTTFAVGQNALLNCQAEGFPEPTNTWMKAVGNLPQEYGEVSVGHRQVQHLENGSLYISNIQEEFEGYYLCQVSNGIGGGLSKVFFLDVQVPVQFDLKLKNVSAKTGDTARLVCQAKGDTPLKISWKRNGAVLLPTSKERLEIKEYVSGLSSFSTLEIKRVDRADSGLYTCSGKNKFGLDSINLQLIVQEVPDAPYGTHVAEFGSRFAEINWVHPYDGNSRITHFIVHYKRAEDEWGDGSLNITVPGTFKGATISGLDPFTKYTFRLFAANDVGLSEPSEIVAVSTFEEAPSGPPKDIQVEAAEPQSLKISWKPPRIDQWHGDILGYNVGYRMHESGEPFLFKTVDASEEGSGKVILRNLKAYTKYDIVIQAYNRLGAGPASDSVTALTSEDVPRSAPEDIQCTAVTSQSIHVTWNPPAALFVQGVLQGYKVFYKLADNEASEKDVKSTQLLETILHGLEKYRNYSIQVLAFTRVGDGVQSNPIICQTQEDVPDAPADIKAIVFSPAAIILSWRPSNSPNGVIIKYTIYVRSIVNGDENTRKFIILPLNTTLYVKDLKVGQRYEFWVTASTMIGEGQSTKLVSETPSYKVPAKIINFGQRISVTWKSTAELLCHVAGNPYPDVRWSFGSVRLDQSARTFTREGSYIIEEVRTSDSGEYICSVENIYGRDSISVHLDVEAPPQQYTLVMTSTSYNSISVHWKNNAVETKPVIGFTLHYKREFGEWEEKKISPELTSYVLENLWCGTRYQMYIVASNNIGNSEPSEVLSIRTKGNGPEFPSKEKLLKGFTNFVSLHLTAWDDSGCEILYFVIEYKPAKSSNWILVSNNVKPQRESFILPDLQPNIAYNLRITAHNSAGSATAEYTFDLRDSKEVSMKTGNSAIVETPFYYDVKLMVPVIVAIISLFVIIAIYAICVGLRWNKITRKSRAKSEDIPHDEKCVEQSPQSYPAKKLDYLMEIGKKPTPARQNYRKNFDEDVSPYATCRVSDGKNCSSHMSTWCEIPVKTNSDTNQSSCGALYPNVETEESRQHTKHKMNHEYSSPVKESIGNNIKYLHRTSPEPCGQVFLEPNDLLYHGTESSSTSDETSPEAEWAPTSAATHHLPNCYEHNSQNERQRYRVVTGADNRLPGIHLDSSCSEKIDEMSHCATVTHRILSTNIRRSGGVYEDHITPNRNYVGNF